MLDAIAERNEITVDQITTVIELADDIRELNRQIAALPGAVVAQEGAES